jgi:hypothetical protein
MTPIEVPTSVRKILLPGQRLERNFVSFALQKSPRQADRNEIRAIRVSNIEGFVLEPRAKTSEL